MKNFCPFLLYAMLVNAIAGVAILTTHADDFPYIRTVYPNDIEILVYAWPSSPLQSGDCIYVVFVVRNNHSNMGFRVKPQELFDNNIYDETTKTLIQKVPGYPKYEFLGIQDYGVFERIASIVEVEDVVIPPNSSSVVFTDIYSNTNRVAVYPATTEEGEFVLKQFGQVGDEPVEMRIVNFAEKYASRVKQPWPAFRVIRQFQVAEDMINRIHRKSTEPVFHTERFGYRGKVETASGDYTMQIFLPALRISDIRPDSEANLSNLSEWVDFENITKARMGTLYFEVHLGRLQVQYLDGDQEGALDELHKFFKTLRTHALPMVMAIIASHLSLPEGLEVESENDNLFMLHMPPGLNSEEQEAQLQAHKHYMAMRRAFDEVVRPYNTLPKRKLREKSESK